MDHIETSIRERAYALWERDGRRHGRDAHYWALAEQELRGASEAPVAARESGTDEAVEAQAVPADVVAKPARKPAARKSVASKPAAKKVAAETPAAKAAVKAVTELAQAAAKPAPRRRRSAAAETVTTH
ncbi:DUF2934 domain-containing protein [Methylobacterium indicum]|uniref:DUF2934 domain-containing protein n=1 Tax=Methylobacterium indicum TaxID=1775910 RepID=A0ABR5H210_9HYPH|nr:DUF2934 domain-containing protein [Methylobacterium indicum]KMO10899.1 hypothetical protein QR78_29280 [Methylobacterium indicum]KMO17270.1 hypothetical protein QR79_21955 [Methylobacterium indicum]